MLTVLNFYSLGHTSRQEVDLLAWVVGYFEFQLLCAVKVHSELPRVWNVRVKLPLWSCLLLSAEVLLGLRVITGAAFQAFTNSNTLAACHGAALWLFGPSVSQEMCTQAGPRGQLRLWSALQAEHPGPDPAPQEGQCPILVWWNYLLVDLLLLFKKPKQTS